MSLNTLINLREVYSSSFYKIGVKYESIFVDTKILANIFKCMVPYNSNIIISIKNNLDIGSKIINLLFLNYLWNST